MSGKLRSNTLRFTAKGYQNYYGNTFNTCGEGNLDKKKKLNIQQCADFCSANPDCNYFYLNDNGWCGLYAACEWKNMRQPKLAGSTYKKKAA